jgi:hypothetical protein
MDEKILKTSVGFIILAILFAAMMPIINANSDSIACRNDHMDFDASDLTTLVNGTIPTDESGFNYNSSDYTNVSIIVYFTLPVSVDNDTTRTLYFRVYTNTTTNVDELDNATLFYTGGNSSIAIFIINRYASHLFDNETYDCYLLFDITTTNTSWLVIEVYWLELECNVTELLPIQTIYTILFPILILIGGMLAIVGFKKQN